MWREVDDAQPKDHSFESRQEYEQRNVPMADVGNETPIKDDRS